jgi:hypothetical protein
MLCPGFIRPHWLLKLPVVLVIMQQPWFIRLSIVRVLDGGTSAPLLVERIDLE